MKTYLLNVALLFIAMGATAQTNYQPGYVVTNSSDTIRGYINYRDLQYTIQTINFKKATTDNNPTTYGPADLKSFGIDPFYSYLSFSGRVSNNKNSFPQIDIEKDTTTTPALLFLQLIANGPNAALYINNDQLKTRFFLKEKNGKPVELIYYEYANTGEKPHKVSAFIGPLTEAFNRYNSYNDSKLRLLQNTGFTQAGLENALALINNNIVDKNAAPSNTKFFAGIGISQVNSDIQPRLTGADRAKSSNISPKISFGFDVVNNPDVQKLILRLELSVASFSPRYTFSYNPDGIHEIDGNTYKFDQYTIAITPQILYNVYNSPKFKFFLSGGLSIGYSIYQNNVMNYNQIVSFAPYTLTAKVDNTVKYYNMSIFVPVQAGVVLNKNIELAANYMPPLNILSSSDLKMQGVGVSLRYLFKR